MNFEDMPIDKQFFAGFDKQALKVRAPWPREAEDRVNQLLGQLAARELECQRLREELAAEKKWGELWYFVSDEAPLAFEKIVSEWTPSRWIDQAHKLMAAKRGA